MTNKTNNTLLHQIIKYVGLVVVVLSVNINVVVDGAMLGRTRHVVPNQRSISFRNWSGRRVDVEWVNVNAKPETYHSQNGGEGYPYGGETFILSYIGHTFQVKEMPAKKTGRCLYDECRTVRFTVNDQENQVFIVGKSFEVTHEDDRQKAYSLAQDLFDECQKDVLGRSESDGGSESILLSPVESIEAITKCMEQRVNETVAVKQEERDFQSNLRKQMAEDLIPYACGDVNYTETQEMLNLTWTHRFLADDENDPADKDKYVTKKFQIKILHQRPTSEIFMIEDFASPEQCKAVEAYLNDEGIVPFRSIIEKTSQGIQLEDLAQQMYALARAQLGWEDLEFTDTDKLGHPLFVAAVDEREPINAPTHLCVGDKEDYEEDRKAGKCRLMGEKPLVVETKPITVEKDTQLAQMYLFCEEPPTLGALHFPFAGVHVEPKVGKLVFAINRRLGDKTFDGYVTETHLCPNHHVYLHNIESV